jgi:putative glycosyl hydrolase or carbohydrate binding protein/type IX secretion system substrate protein
MFLLCFLLGYASMAQTTITNGGFELWGNTSPGIAAEPTNWYSNQSGSAIAKLGAETCFKDNAIFHSGLYSVRLETIAGPLSTVINGSVTTGVVNAPSLTKSDGYIGTVNFSTSTDDRRMSFTGRPDSLVGWYQYTSGGAGEKGKIRAILHTGDYYDPETPITYHVDPTVNKIADDTFFTPTATVATWTRFSVPFTYVSTASPTYIMINATSSANQGTTVTGSKLWLDDLQVVYKAAEGVSNVAMNEDEANVYSYGATLCISLSNPNEEQSLISMFDMAGKRVFTQSMTNNKFSSFNLSSLNAGIYVYRLSNSSYCKTGKLFIQ